MEKCPRETCYWPEVGCDLGHPDHTRCPSWKADQPSDQDTQQSSDAMVMPWSGNPLGLADLSFVAGCGKPYVLAIIGPENCRQDHAFGRLVSASRAGISSDKRVWIFRFLFTPRLGIYRQFPALVARTNRTNFSTAYHNRQQENAWATPSRLYTE